MSQGSGARLRSRVRRQHRSGRGLTIIELLVSLSLLMLMTASLAGGLQMLRRAFDTDRRAQIGAESDQAIDILANQIAAAFPLNDRRTGRLDFGGRPHAIAFARLDQGRANRAGLQRAVIAQTGDDLTMTLTSLEQGPNIAPSTPRAPVVLLSRVGRIQFSYFGAVGQSPKPVWRTEWSAMERLPELVSIEVGFKDAALPPVTVLVALRQR